MKRSNLPLTLMLFISFICGVTLRSSAQKQYPLVRPSYPHVCTQLAAHLSASNGQLTATEENHEDTTRIQSAIDHCEPGHAVELSRSADDTIFLTGPITLKPGVTLLIDAGTALYGSRNPRDYDLTPGSCGVVNEVGHGCKALITANHADNSGIMGKGVIDGRGGARLLGQDVSWWDLAHEAKVQHLEQSCPRMIYVHHSDHFTLYQITLRNSPNFHVFIEHSNQFMAWGVRINTPAWARNTDGIDPSSSQNVTITHTYIQDGDDDVAIKAGDAGPSSRITLTDDHFYSGHGMSIGSETNGGVSDVLVQNLSLDGTTNGIRIKSDLRHGGVVDHITYQNICMRDVSHPLFFTPHYDNHSGNHVPVYRDILLQNVNILTPGDYTLLGTNAQQPLAIQLDNVWAEGLNRSKFETGYAVFTLGPSLGSLRPASGNAVQVKTLAGSRPGKPLDCTDAFVPFPVNSSVPNSEQNEQQQQALYVSHDAMTGYASIQAAINAAPATGATIHIAPGVYREVLTIDKPNLHLLGDGPTPANTVIVDDKSAEDSGGTFHSATISAYADGFFAENLTIENDWNRTHQQTSKGSQAIALLLAGDRSILSNVRILGNQDTLYVGLSHGGKTNENNNTPREYFSHCYIAGNVDYIFGNGRAYFSHCTIVSTSHGEDMITAQSRDTPQQNSAFVFDHCRLVAAPGAHHVWLGRPWRAYAKVIYLNTWMAPQIEPAGWREWHPGKTHRLDTAWYATYDSTGPGADLKAREPESHALTAALAANFSLVHFFPLWHAQSELQQLQSIKP